MEEGEGCGCGGGGIKVFREPDFSSRRKQHCVHLCHRTASLA